VPKAGATQLTQTQHANALAICIGHPDSACRSLFANRSQKLSDSDCWIPQPPKLSCHLFEQAIKLAEHYHTTHSGWIRVKNVIVGDTTGSRRPKQIVRRRC
jgi:hypothetical protein